jgi:eukaryotic-like serine/threonine-protein kinase
VKAPEGQLVLPSEFGRYTLVERLATGGMAEVFRAKIISSHGFEKVIVIKRILPHMAVDATFVSMFIDEAKLTAQLTHPKIVQVLDFGTVGGAYFIGMEFIDGQDGLALLRAAAQKRIRVPLSLVVFVVSEILDALDYAHTACDMEGRPMRLVHRDISPSNIFISRHGDVKLGDFGIARSSDSKSQTQVGTLKGKYGYMSPEQVIGGALDARSDLFAVGIVLAEALIGRRLFTSRNELDVLLMVRDARLDRLNRYGHDIPPELLRIVRKALNRELGGRYQTADGFRADLSDYLFSQRIRVGAADLRAFMGELFDPSQAALARVQTQGRRVSESNSRTALPAATSTAPFGDLGEQVASRPGRMLAPAKVTGAAVEALEIDYTAEALVEDTSASLSSSPPSTGAARRSVGSEADSGSDAPPASPLDDVQWSSDLALVDLDQWSISGPNPTGSPAGAVPVSTPRTDVGRFVSAAPNRPADSTGDLGTISPMRIFANLTIAGESGLLRFERDAEPSDGESAEVEVKEVFLASGSPESVSSTVAGERFGAYLVSRGILRAAELDTAIEMLSHFSGKLGDTLVGLGLMRPLEVFRQLSQQVRDRVIDLFRWSRGTFAFFRGVSNPQDSFPLGLDGFEILGAGVMAIPVADLKKRFAALGDRRPRGSPHQRVDPDAFRLGPTPREVLTLLKGQRTLNSWLTQLKTPDEIGTFLRSLHLLLETDLAELD